MLKGHSTGRVLLSGCGRFSLYLFLFLLKSLCSAQLSWQTQQLDFHPTEEEKAVHGDFFFTNTGNSTTTITEVKTSCGCTTATLEKKTYKPGEKGKIEATFTIGDRIGVQEKQIMVRTSDPNETITKLNIRAFIPEWLKMDPWIVHWDLESAKNERTVKLTAGTDQPIKVLGVRASDDRLFAKLKMIEAGRSYEVSITPITTTEPLHAVVRVDTDYPPQKPKVFFLPVEIGMRVNPPISPPEVSSPKNPDEIDSGKSRMITPVSGK